MNEDVFNMELRKFLKKVGITAQREIEAAVRQALENGTITGTETLEARVELSVSGAGLTETIEGSIALE